MTDVVALIAAGKTAVENYIGDIEKGEAQAAAAFKAQRVEISSALLAYQQAHAQEVSTAAALVIRATGVTPSAPASGIPASTLSQAVAATKLTGGWFAKAKNFVVALGWKGVVLAVVGLGALHYLHAHGII